MAQHAAPPARPALPRPAPPSGRTCSPASMPSPSSPCSSASTMSASSMREVNSGAASPRPSTSMPCGAAAGATAAAGHAECWQLGAGAAGATGSQALAWLPPLPMGAMSSHSPPLPCLVGSARLLARDTLLPALVLLVLGVAQLLLLSGEAAATAAAAALRAHARSAVRRRRRALCRSSTARQVLRSPSNSCRACAGRG